MLFPQIFCGWNRLENGAAIFRKLVQSWDVTDQLECQGLEIGWQDKYKVFENFDFV